MKRWAWLVGLLVLMMLPGCMERALTPSWVYDDGDRVHRIELETDRFGYALTLRGRGQDGGAYAFDASAVAWRDGIPWENRTLEATDFQLSKDGEGHEYRWEIIGFPPGHHVLLLNLTLTKTGAELSAQLNDFLGDPFWSVRER